MIVHLDKSISEDELQNMARNYEGVLIRKSDYWIMVTSAGVQEVDGSYSKFVKDRFVFKDDIQLASSKYVNGKRTIRLGDKVIGGDHKNTLVIAGPCSAESEAQLEVTAKLLKELGITTMRAGCFKPRTSPYTFQGLGREGLKLLDKIRDKYGFHIITEVRDATHVEDVIAFTDIIQVGAKAMYDHGILRHCGKADKPVLLKRGFGSTLQEFVQAAEFVLSGGNEDVILCERGIRTFENKTRFTLDLCGAAYLKKYTNLPVVLDPSHAMGKAYGVPDLSRACLAMGVEGLLIETHPEPSKAKSDAAQQLDHKTFRALYADLQKMAPCMGRKLL